MTRETDKTKGWMSILAIALNNRKDLLKLLTDEEQRERLQFFAMFVTFGVISLGMTVLNVITGWRLLAAGTFVFGVLNVINVVLCLICYRTEHVARTLFGLEIILTFTYFAIIGEPDGFSVIWVALLPACGLLLYGFRSGTILSMVQMAILVVLFWIPSGRSLLMYDYTESFAGRFPLLYMAFFFVGLVFEVIIVLTQRELAETRDMFEYQSIHDPLTGILNRGGFNRTLDEFIVECKGKDFAFAICDLDRFKAVNDMFGHQNGDKVLKYIADKLTEIVGENGTVCRWGGEEFAVFFKSGVDAEALCETIREEIKRFLISTAGNAASQSVRDWSRFRQHMQKRFQT